MPCLVLKSLKSSSEAFFTSKPKPINTITTSEAFLSQKPSPSILLGRPRKNYKIYPNNKKKKKLSKKETPK